MAREWVRDRLENWAAWLTQRDSGSCGYPRVNILQMNRGSPATTDCVPINGIEASETHRAVQTLRQPQVNLWLALMCRYVGNPSTSNARRSPMTYAEIGQVMAVSESTALNWVRAAEAAVDMALSVSHRNAGVE
jgi:hypothetical protein